MHLLIVIAGCLGIMFLLSRAALPHSFYSNWMNKNNQGCCNNRDCKPIADNEERTENGRLLVRVRGVGVAKGQAEWCPVLSHHYLSTGNAPDGSVSHVCVTDFYGGTNPCSQFICYQPKPMM